MSTLRAAIVGAGFMGERHFRTLSAFEDVVVVAIADADEERRRALAGRSGATGYRDYVEMLDREKPDAVWICVPPFVHPGPELAVLERGLPFFIEKPLSVDLKTAEEVARAVEEMDVLTAVGYHWRYLDTTERVVELMRLHPPRLALGYWLDFTPPPPWWIRRDGSGGQMIEQTTHIFDLTRLLVGDVTRVHAIGARTERAAFPEADVDDVAVAMLEFASGAVGTVASTALLERPHRIGLELVSEGIVVELSECELVIERDGERAVIAPAVNPFARENRAFIDAIRGSANEIRVPYAEALRTHRLANAATRSAREGVPVELAYACAG